MDLLRKILKSVAAIFFEEDFQKLPLKEKSLYFCYGVEVAGKN